MTWSRSRLAAAVLVLGLAPRANAADPVKGEALFQERCTLCHQLDVPGQGPPLKGVVGRKAGTVPDFPYTDAMKTSGVTWTPEKLDQYLAGPRDVVPGTAMIQSVPDPDERADLIAYLSKHP